MTTRTQSNPKKLQIHNPLEGLNLGGGIDSYLRDTREDVHEDPNHKQEHIETKTKESIAPAAPVDAKVRQQSSRTRGLKTGYIRHSFAIKEESLEKIQRMSYWDRVDIKDIFNEAIEKYLDGHNPKPIPAGRK